MSYGGGGVAPWCSNDCTISAPRPPWSGPPGCIARVIGSTRPISTVVPIGLTHLLLWPTRPNSSSPGSSCWASGAGGHWAGRFVSRDGPRRVGQAGSDASDHVGASRCIAFMPEPLPRLVIGSKAEEESRDWAVEGRERRMPMSWSVMVQQPLANIQLKLLHVKVLATPSSLIQRSKQLLTPLTTRPHDARSTSTLEATHYQIHSR